MLENHSVTLELYRDNHAHSWEKQKEIQFFFSNHWDMKYGMDERTTISLHVLFTKVTTTTTTGNDHTTLVSNITQCKEKATLLMIAE